MRPILVVAFTLINTANLWGQTPAELTQGLGSKDVQIRRASAEKVGRKRIQTANPQLQELLKDDDADVRRTAATALARFGVKGAKSLGAALEFPREESRSAALLGLRELGPDAKEVVPAIIPMLKAKDRDQRILAALILRETGADGRAALPALFEASRDTANIGAAKRMDMPSSVCEAAVDAAIAIDPKCTEELARAILPDLIKSMKAGNQGDLLAIFTTLAKLGKSAKPALEAIREAKKNVRGGFLEEAAQHAVNALSGDEFAEEIAKFNNQSLPVEKRLQALAGLRYRLRDRAKIRSIVATDLKDKNPAVRAEAVSWVSMVGPESQDFLPTLIELLGDQELEKHGRQESSHPPVVAALSEIGKPAVHALIDILNDKKTGNLVRWRTVETLAVIGPAAREALPALAATIQEKLVVISVEAAGAFALVGGDFDKVLPILRSGLKIKTPIIAYRTASIIEKIAPFAQSAIPELIALLDHPEVEIRIVAARALCKMGAPARPAVKRMAELLKENNIRQRVQITEALGNLGPDAADAIPVLIEQFKNEQTQVFGRVSPSSSLTVLQKMGDAAAPALPFLTKLIQDAPSVKDQWNVDQALLNLGAIGPAAAGAVPDLISMLTSKDERRRANAARALGMLGRAAKSAEKQLQQLALDKSKLVRVWAAYALANVADDPSKSVEQLMDEWTEGAPRKGGPQNFAANQNMAIAEALILLGPKGRGAQDILIDGLQTQRSLLGVHHQIALALAAVSNEPAVILPILLGQLNSRKDSGDVFLRGNIIDALGKMGPKAKPSVPDLKRLLDEADAERGMLIRNALQKIEGK